MYEHTLTYLKLKFVFFATRGTKTYAWNRFGKDKPASNASKFNISRPAEKRTKNLPVAKSYKGNVLGIISRGSLYNEELI